MMRAKRGRIIDEFKVFFPLLFWRECWVCKNEYRWEGMWKLTSTPRYPIKQAWSEKYICFKCAPDALKAEQIIKVRLYTRPPAPPPPPNPPPRNS